MKIVGVNDDGGGGDDDDDEEIPNMGVNEDEIRTNFLFVSLPDRNWKNQELMFFFSLQWPVITSRWCRPINYNIRCSFI